MALQGSGKALLSQCQGSKFLRETSQGRAGIVKPIKPEISEWGHFFNMKISVLFYFSANSCPDSAASSAGAQRAEKLGRRRFGLPEILPVVVKKFIKMKLFLLLKS